MVTLGTSAVVALVSASGASAAPQDEPGLAAPSVTSFPSPGDVASLLTLPAVSEDQDEWLGRVNDELADRPDFIAVTISDDRETATITWSGDTTTELEELLEAAPTGTTVEIARSAHSGQELRDALAEVFTAAPTGVQVSSGGVMPDGSGLALDVVGSASARMSTSAVESALESALGGEVPVSVTLGPEPVSAFHGRWNDPYTIGGAALYNHTRGNLCTSGFAVTSRGTKGMMTAAHCGAVGDSWARPASPGFPAGGAYVYGKAVRRTTHSDGMIIQGGGNYQPYVWTSSAWDDDQNGYLPVSGPANLAVGSELCFSGAFSGLRCGSRVDIANATWNLGGDLSRVSGVRTSSRADAAGQGDSGGPGVVVVSGAQGWSLRAGSIVSGGPGVARANCPGKPGARVCGATVFSGRFTDIAAQTGVSLMTP